MDAMVQSRLGGVLLLCAGLTLAGCRSAQPNGQSISLHADETAMKAEILQHIPIGTPVHDAERIMIANGFDCSFVDADGDDPPFLFCDIYKAEKWPVSQRWLISFEYVEDKVTSVGVGTGLIGP
jgi:hypothetical protein